MGSYGELEPNFLTKQQLKNLASKQDKKLLRWNVKGKRLVYAYTVKSDHIKVGHSESQSFVDRAYDTCRKYREKCDHWLFLFETDNPKRDEKKLKDALQEHLATLKGTHDEQSTEFFHKNKKSMETLFKFANKFEKKWVDKRYESCVDQFHEESDTNEEVVSQDKTCDRCQKLERSLEKEMMENVCAERYNDKLTQENLDLKQALAKLKQENENLRRCRTLFLIYMLLWFCFGCMQWLT